jgi:ribosomal protein S18 acetylase RimI-like enzyme
MRSRPGHELASNAPMSHAAYHASCFLDPTNPPSCRCNHLCHDGGASICTAGADEQYRRLGHADEVVGMASVCHACAAAMVALVERN